MKFKKKKRKKKKKKKKFTIENTPVRPILSVKLILWRFLFFFFNPSFKKAMSGPAGGRRHRLQWIALIFGRDEEDQ